ncbi:hypothetical protein K488DRAFT_67679 [Vararia minispora EC-137]|uniref:Uncharacterized protein n=1 Tax=Vararia minispora EC-137 TaxID=1314806 RepID=A0ACB8QXH9_9AGAM|nr:hypothetical protein K488DRAFT_67679 [Vararia minispora EC-137]
MLGSTLLLPSVVTKPAHDCRRGTCMGRGGDRNRTTGAQKDEYIEKGQNGPTSQAEDREENKEMKMSAVMLRARTRGERGGMASGSAPRSDDVVVARNDSREGVRAPGFHRTTWRCRCRETWWKGWDAEATASGAVGTPFHQAGCCHIGQPLKLIHHSRGGFSLSCDTEETVGWSWMWKSKGKQPKTSRRTVTRQIY